MCVSWTFRLCGWEVCRLRRVRSLIGGRDELHVELVSTDVDDPDQRPDLGVLIRREHGLPVLAGELHLSFGVEAPGHAHNLSDQRLAGDGADVAGHLPRPLELPGQ